LSFGNFSERTAVTIKKVEIDWGASLFFITLKSVSVVQVIKLLQRI